MRAVLSPVGGCRPAPRASLGEGWTPRGPHQLQGAPLTYLGSLSGTARCPQLAGGPVPPVRSGTSRLPRVGKAFGQVSLELPTCVQRLRVLCELAGLGSCGSLSPWRDEIAVQLAAGGGCLWRTCGEKDEAWDGGGCAGTKAPAVLPSPALSLRQLLATTARLSSVPSCSPPLGHRCGAARASAIPAPALPQRNPRSRAWPATFPPSPPPPPHCQALSPSSPSPHLAALVQAWQPLLGLGAGIRLLLLGHLRGPLPDPCHRHPGETLALLGVGTLGL